MFGRMIQYERGDGGQNPMDSSNSATSDGCATASRSAFSHTLEAALEEVSVRRMSFTISPDSLSRACFDGVGFSLLFYDAIVVPYLMA